jgi:RHS repeat-associated protein
MIMPGRSGGEDYRFGFQGEEHDNEVSGNRNSVNFRYRVHDPRLGRFHSRDPLSGAFPWNSPYVFSENQILHAIEFEGLERIELNKTGEIRITDKMILGSEGSERNILIAEVYAATISMDYMVVSSDGLGVPDLDPAEFHDRFVMGNTSFTSSGVTPGSFRSSNGGSYVVNVSYNYNIVGSGSLEDVAAWQSEDMRGRGIIFGLDGSQKPRIMRPNRTTVYTPRSSEWPLDQPLILGSENGTIATVVSEENVFDNPRYGGFVTATLLQHMRDCRHIFAQSNIGGAAMGYALNYMGINLASAGLSMTLIAVHEAGHHASSRHRHNTGSYEYHQPGLQSNTNPYPTLQNTINILNEGSNY